MAVLKGPVDRIRQLVVATGLGDYTIDDAQETTDAFSGDRKLYLTVADGYDVIYAVEGLTSGEWEIGRGLLNGTVLERSTIIYSSNAGAKIDWSVVDGDLALSRTL